MNSVGANNRGNGHGPGGKVTKYVVTFWIVKRIHAKNVKNEIDREENTRKKLHTPIAISKCCRNFGIVSIWLLTYRPNPCGSSDEQEFERFRRNTGLKTSPIASIVAVNGVYLYQNEGVSLVA